MKRFKNILVAVDTRLKQHPIIEEAAEIARRNGAALKIVDCVPEFAWAVRMSMTDHQHMRELIAQEKRENLAALAAPLELSGLTVETKVLFGKTSLEIIREVLRADHDLVLRVAKGKDSRRSGFFGATALGLLRKCPCPVWLVSPETTPKFSHVLGCVDVSTGDPLDEELNDQVFELASSISQYHGGRFSILHAWSIYGEQMLISRMKPEAFEAMVKNSEHQISRMLDEFLDKHDSGIDNDNVRLEKGEPPDVIANFIRENKVDLVVMGTVARSGLSGMIIGNTAEQILSRIECSVLALKPAGFVCPVQR